MKTNARMESEFGSCASLPAMYIFGYLGSILVLMNN